MPFSPDLTRKNKNLKKNLIGGIKVGDDILRKKVYKNIQGVELHTFNRQTVANGENLRKISHF